MRAPVRTFTRAKHLRRVMTAPETTLWSLLRRRTVSHLRFRRQHPIGPYILDFYCAAAKLCIEIDGAAHLDPDQIDHDSRRTEWLNERGIRVLRFTAGQVLGHANQTAILLAIVQAAAPSTASGGPPPP